MEAYDPFGELYAEHRDYLIRYMFMLSRDREEAADLVHETFLRLCQQGRLPEHPRAWLSQTGYRLFIDGWRRKRRYTWLPLDASRDAACYETPEQAVLDREQEEAINNLLRRLNPRMRAMFEWRMNEGCSYREIANRLNCPENTVKTWMRRGKHLIIKSFTATP